MKTLLKYLLLILITVIVNGLLTGIHANLFDLRYEQCKAKLIAENNYQSTEQAITCTLDSSVTLRVLGTILFKDGSYLGSK